MRAEPVVDIKRQHIKHPAQKGLSCVSSFQRRIVIGSRKRIFLFSCRFAGEESRSRFRLSTTCRPSIGTPKRVSFSLKCPLAAHQPSRKNDKQFRVETQMKLNVTLCLGPPGGSTCERRKSALSFRAFPGPAQPPAPATRSPSLFQMRI